MNIAFFTLFISTAFAGRCGAGFAECGATDCCQVGMTCVVEVSADGETQGSCVATTEDTSTNCDEPQGQLLTNDNLRAHLTADFNCAHVAQMQLCNSDLKNLYPAYVTTSERVGDDCPVSCNSGTCGSSSGGSGGSSGSNGGSSGSGGTTSGSGAPNSGGSGSSGSGHSGSGHSHQPPTQIMNVGDCEKMFDGTICAATIGCMWYPLDNHGYGKCNDYGEDLSPHGNFPWQGVPGSHSPYTYGGGPTGGMPSGGMPSGGMPISQQDMWMLYGDDAMDIKDYMQMHGYGQFANGPGGPHPQQNLPMAGTPVQGAGGQSYQLIGGHSLVLEKRNWLAVKQQICHQISDESTCGIEQACAWSQNVCAKKDIVLPELQQVQLLSSPKPSLTKSTSADLSTEQQFYQWYFYITSGIMFGALLGLAARRCYRKPMHSDFHVALDPVGDNA